MQDRPAEPARVKNNINHLAIPASMTAEVQSTTEAVKKPVNGSEPQPNLLIVAERRDFVRGCLTCWLGSSCGEFETLAVAGVETSLADDALAQAAAVLFGLGASEQIDAWLDREIKWLRAKRPDVPIIIIMEADEVSAAEALVGRLEVQGYIPTSSSTKVAAAALRLVVAGGRYFPTIPAGGRPPAQTPTDPIQPTWAGERFAKLTPREEAVLSVLGNGAQNKIIAYRLGMSLSTVKAHVHSIIRKLNVRNRTEVVVAAREVQGLASRMNGAKPIAIPPDIPAPPRSTGTDIAYRSPVKEEPVARP
jgi:DNA-binding NarL/FixJ family response regulator